MFLRALNLSGFKSFVNLTKLTFPSKLTAVVGPNGSGKSNVIDALSWVLGENSMKHLRGEVLTDVIFNGSTARKPVGQASVELIFENLDGMFGGEYSNYAEISIKRTISRDSDSTYYLNNSPCRRRDILSIFSGTGLGPRSYSIIGQNMVSRIVESKPGDMRAYLEEAAGISKYKERRHETELRIGHTKDNLERVNDLRTELDRQLTSLKRQASDAERYKTLKEQERLTKAQWHSIQWKQLDTQLIQYTLTIQQEDTAQEALQSEFIEVEVALDNRRQEQRTANEVFQDVQRRYYSVGNEITRIEQDVMHQQERQSQLEADFKQVGDDWQASSDQLEEVRDELEELATDVVQLEPEWESAVERAKQAVRMLAQADESSRTWQTRWDTFHQQTMKVSQQAEIERARVQHLQQKLESIQHQQSKIKQEQSTINFSELDEQIQELLQQLQEVESNIEQHQEQLEEVRREITDVQQRRQQSSAQLDQVRSELQKLRGKQASVEALQQAALGQRDLPVLKWLAQHDLDKKPRLAQGIEVEQGWEFAVEKVLGPYLQAVCVDQVASIASKISNFNEGQLLAFSNSNVPAVERAAKNAQRLLDKVRSSLPVHSLLAGVYVTETLDDALTLLSNLDTSESVITRDGIWLSPAWFRISHDKDPKAGVFQREQELKQLQSSIFELEDKQSEVEATLVRQQEQLVELDQRREQLQQALNQSRARASDINAQQKARQERLTEIKRKSDQLHKEQEEYLAQENQANDELKRASDGLQQAEDAKQKYEAEREDLVLQRENAQIQLQAARLESDEAKEQSHQLEIRLQSSKSQQGSLQQTVERMQTQLAALAERKHSLENDLSTVHPLENLKETLNRTLGKHVVIEGELNNARSSMETLEQELEKLDKQRHSVEQGLARVRTNLETLRLDSQGLRLKEESLQEQIKELGLAVEDVIKELPAEANTENAVQDWQNQYERIVSKITRLGSINLIAVEEYATCQERKIYLDKQFEDLQSSLATLEDAIAKIDRETRARFRETFDKINARFQELFPLVFGGGHATLELTDENLLESGVAVMACPPGKRNSSIHLLSGGEKTMTAIALIFSIFHLNPSPLCLLDEVDAALDDMNVLRYCNLVKSMSDKTQFVFISHNKLAIEMAEHLIGVTMHEPGVSRLVSVDMQEAISMATA